MQNLANRVRQPNEYSVSALPSPKCLRKHLRRRESLHRAGELFDALFVVRFGHFKSLCLSEDGVEQVTDFLIVGDVIGLDGIDTGRHQSEVVTLDEAEVFVLPLARCEQWSRASAYAQRLLARILAHKIGRYRDHMLMLGTMTADQRLATFLLDMSERYGQLGYSRSQFVLRMTRQDIASYLGLKIETVCRALSRLQQHGVIQLQGRLIALLDFSALYETAGTSRDRQRLCLDPILNQEGELQSAPPAY